MMYVVLRNGKVLKYNNGRRVSNFAGSFCVEDENREFLAIIPVEVVERVEAEPPCKVLRAKSRPKRSNYKG